MRLVFAFVIFVATSGSAASPGDGSRVGIFYKDFIRNNLLLKLLRTFSLALNNNPKLFKKDFFQVFLYPYQNFCLLSAFSIDKCPSCMSLKETTDSEYLLNL